LNEDDLRKGIYNAKAYDPSKIIISAELKQYNQKLREKFIETQKQPGALNKNIKASSKSKKILKGRRRKGVEKEVSSEVERKKQNLDKGIFDFEVLMTWQKNLKSA